MDTINTCRLCLEYKNKVIEFFSDQGIDLNISKVLEQHFWFQIHQDDNLPMGICRVCWKFVKAFHDFYKNILSKHKSYYNIEIKTDPTTITHIKTEIIESNNDSLSFFNSNTDLQKSTVEKEIQHDKTVSDKTTPSTGVTEVDETSKSLKAHTDSKNVSENADIVDTTIKTTPIKIIKEQGQFTEENPIIVNTNISDGNPIRDELMDISTDNIENNDVLENRKVVKNIDTPLRVTENADIVDTTINTTPIKIIKEQEQFTEENPIIVNTNISDGSPIRDELMDKSTDNIENKDVLENRKIVKNIDTPLIVTENADIVDTTINTTPIKIIKEQEQFTEENPIIVNTNISDGSPIRDELMDKSTDNIENKDVLENRKIVKNIDTPLRVTENADIVDTTIKTTPIKIIKEQEQFTEENPIIVNTNISDGSPIRDELMDKSTDNIENKDVLEKRKIGKNIDTPLRVAEDIQIKEFYNLKCAICSSKHSTIEKIRKHYLDVHKRKRGYVLCCKKKLYNRGGLLAHMLWHVNPNEFKCKVCNKLFGDKFYLKKHMYFHLKPDERDYICDICQASFTVRNHLLRHFRKVHRTQTKEFKCNQCDKIFNKISSLRYHIQGVHELKNVSTCHICGKVYSTKSKCQMHYLEDHVNANKPKVKCNLCDVLLKNESSLKCHMRRKHSDNPVGCNLCGKIIQNRNSLQNHIKNVHAERTHKCNLCDKAFKKPIGLKEHMATHSGKCILYTCPYCTTTFNSQSNMHSHRKKVHPAKWLEDRQKRLGITTK